MADTCVAEPTETVWQTFAVEEELQVPVTITLADQNEVCSCFLARRLSIRAKSVQPRVTDIIITSSICSGLGGLLGINCQPVTTSIQSTISERPSSITSTSSVLVTTTRVTSTPVSTLFAPCSSSTSSATSSSEPESSSSSSSTSEEPVSSEPTSLPSSSAPSSSLPESSPSSASEIESSEEPEDVVIPRTSTSFTPVTVFRSASTAIQSSRSSLPPRESSNSETKDEAEGKVGLIIGSVVGAVAGILLLLFLAKTFYRHWNRNKDLEDMDQYFNSDHHTSSHHSFDEYDRNVPSIEDFSPAPIESSAAAVATAVGTAKGNAQSHQRSASINSQYTISKDPLEMMERRPNSFSDMPISTSGPWQNATTVLRQPSYPPSGFPAQPPLPPVPAPNPNANRQSVYNSCFVARPMSVYSLSNEQPGSRSHSRSSSINSLHQHPQMQPPFIQQQQQQRNVTFAIPAEQAYNPPALAPLAPPQFGSSTRDVEPLLSPMDQQVGGRQTLRVVNQSGGQ